MTKYTSLETELLTSLNNSRGLYAHRSIPNRGVSPREFYGEVGNALEITAPEAARLVWGLERKGIFGTEMSTSVWLTERGAKALKGKRFRI